MNVAKAVKLNKTQFMLTLTFSKAMQWAELESLVPHWNPSLMLDNFTSL